MKLLVFDHFFDVDTEALRAVAPQHELRVVSYVPLRQVAQRYFPPSVFTDYDAWNLPEHAAARRAFEAEARAMLRRIHDDYPFDLVVSPSDVFFYLRPWVDEAHALGKPFAVVQKETTIAPFTMEQLSRTVGRAVPFISDLMTVCSERQKEFWLRTGADADLIHVTGQPRFDFYLHPERWLGFAELGLALPAGRPTVLFLSYDASAYSPEGTTQPWLELRNETEEALLALARSGACNVLVKPHPQQDGQTLTARLAALSGPAFGSAVQLVPPEADLRHLVTAADVVVGFQTTALFEAMMADKPVVHTFWTDAAERHAGRVVPFHEMGDALVVARSPQELVDAVLGAAPPAAAQREARRARWEEYLGPVDGRASERVVEILEGLVAERRHTPAAPAPAERRPKVLCYAPYNMWDLHGKWEMTILHGVRLRGADVHYVMVDDLYTDCDLFWKATSPRTELSALQSQAAAARLALEMGTPYRWLGRYLTLDEEREARRLADSLAADELPTATCGDDWRVGEWVRSSVHSHFRMSRLDLSDPEVEAVYRSYVFSGLVACFALTRLLDDYEPDVLFEFSGRMSSTRVALELARRRGVRVVCHEQGYLPESLQLFENDGVLSLRPFRQLWADWADVPLSHDELAAVRAYLAEREHGKHLPRAEWAPAPQAAEEVRAQLGLAPGRRVWTLFTSSDDEVIANAEWGGAFGSQLEWIERSVAFAAAHPEIDLVIRAHPNTAGRRAIGSNLAQLRELEELARRVPPSVRVVMPEDEVSTYALMDLSAVGLVYQSTAGLEMATKGKRVVVAAGNVVHGTSFVRTVADAGAYEPLLEELLPTEPNAVFPDVARLAHRFAYAMFFRHSLPFPLVHRPDRTNGVLVYRSLADLAPGREPTLDRVVRIVLGEEPVCPPPSAAERARPDDAETAVFGTSGRRSVSILAFADELIADERLLRRFGERFSAADDVTLVIESPPELTDALVAAVGAAGLDGEDGPDMLAVPQAPADVVAVYSARAGLPGRPRFDAETVDELRALAEAA